MGVSAGLIIARAGWIHNDAPVRSIFNQIASAILNAAAQSRCHDFFTEFIGKVSRAAKKLES